jgi:hypothetical protein
VHAVRGQQCCIYLTGGHQLFCAVYPHQLECVKGQVQLPLCVTPATCRGLNARNAVQLC